MNNQKEYNPFEVRGVDLRGEYNAEFEIKDSTINRQFQIQFFNKWEERPQEFKCNFFKYCVLVLETRIKSACCINTEICLCAIIQRAFFEYPIIDMRYKTMANCGDVFLILPEFAEIIHKNGGNPDLLFWWPKNKIETRLKVFQDLVNYYSEPSILDISKK